MLRTKTDSRYEQAALALCETVPPLLDRHFDGNGTGLCILATRLAVDACHSIGLRAAAMTTEVVACSPELAEWLNNGGDWSPDAPGWSVGILESNDRGSGYNGHLVAVMKDKWMLDLAIGQVHRPQHDLLVKPVFTEIPDDAQRYKAEDSPVGSKVTFENGTTLLYQFQPWRKDFFTAPDWAQTLKRYPQIVKATREAVKGI